MDRQPGQPTVPIGMGKCCVELPHHVCPAHVICPSIHSMSLSANLPTASPSSTHWYRKCISWRGHRGCPRAGTSERGELSGAKGKVPVSKSEERFLCLLCITGQIVPTQSISLRTSGTHHMHHLQDKWYPPIHSSGAEQFYSMHGRMVSAGMHCSGRNHSQSIFASNVMPQGP